jgi:hypothetical protein
MYAKRSAKKHREELSDTHILQTLKPKIPRENPETQSSPSTQTTSREISTQRLHRVPRETQKPLLVLYDWSLKLIIFTQVDIALICGKKRRVTY